MPTRASFETLVLAALLVVTALLLVNAVYVAAEFSAVSVRRSRLQQLAADGHPLAGWLLPLIDSPAGLDRYIAACQVGITLSSLVLGAYAKGTVAVWLAPLLSRLGGFEEAAARTASVVIVLLLLTVAQVVFSELVPKSLALQYSTQAAMYTMLPMVPSLWVYRPFIRGLNGAGMVLLRLVGAAHESHRHIHSPQEIELLIAESRDGGLLELDEHRRLQRALRLHLRHAKQLMVPRRKVSSIDVSMSIRDAITALVDSPYSQLPVHRDSIDDVVGIVHTKDLVRAFVAGVTGPVAGVMRPLTSVHESVTADRVLQHLRERGTHQALVVDEAGGTAGLITLEDVLSEFLGDIGDEFKTAGRSPETLPDGRLRLPGGMPVDDAAVLLATSFETDAATVGGMLTAALEHLPSVGETAVLGGCTFEVERVEGRVPQSILVSRPSPDKEQDPPR